MEFIESPEQSMQPPGNANIRHANITETYVLSWFLTITQEIEFIQGGEEKPKGRYKWMIQTHIEYDDFGEFVETIDLEPVALPQKSLVRRPENESGRV